MLVMFKEQQENWSKGENSNRRDQSRNRRQDHIGLCRSLKVFLAFILGEIGSY